MSKKYSTCNFGNNLHPQDKKAIEEFIEYRRKRALKKKQGLLSDSKKKETGV